jgi:hypothetical protein
MLNFFFCFHCTEHGSSQALVLDVLHHNLVWTFIL